MKRLVPLYQIGSLQKIDGIEVISAQTNSIPRADYGLAFSIRPSDGYPKWLVSQSKMVLLYEEMSSAEKVNPLSPFTQDAETTFGDGAGVYKTNLGVHAILQTGLNLPIKFGRDNSIYNPRDIAALQARYPKLRPIRIPNDEGPFEFPPS